MSHGEQRTQPGFWLPQQERPSWYTPSKYRKTANGYVARGLHPTGKALGDDDKRCKDCGHLYRRKFSKTYIKCDLMPVTGGPATDICAKWRACCDFETRQPIDERGKKRKVRLFGVDGKHADLELYEKEIRTVLNIETKDGARTFLISDSKDGRIIYHEIKTITRDVDALVRRYGSKGLRDGK